MALFADQRVGEDSHAVILFLDKVVGHVIPVRFISFGLVGGLGVVLHLAVLTTLIRMVGLSFTMAQGIATVIAMISNFSLNNVLTFRDMRLRGWRWVRGLMTFVLVCGLGGVANVGIASYLFHRKVTWLVSALTGILVSSGWNYTMSAMYTWNQGIQAE